MLLALLITGTVLSQSSIDIGSGVSITQKRTSENILEISIKKNKGFLGFGFGKSMAQADVFIIETSDDGVSLRSCELNGHVAPSCGMKNWKLKSASLNADGSWTAVVTRDISIIGKNGLIIAKDKNFMLWDYNTSPTLEFAHKEKGNVHSLKEVTMVPVTSDISHTESIKENIY